MTGLGCLGKRRSVQVWRYTEVSRPLDCLTRDCSSHGARRDTLIPALLPALALRWLTILPQRNLFSLSVQDSENILQDEKLSELR